MEYLKPIIIDIDDGSPIIINAKQNDIKSRFLKISIIGNGLPIDLTNHTVKFYAQKPDNTIIFNNVTVLDNPNGIVKVELTSQTLAKAGNVLCELSILGSDSSILTTKLFIINVQQCVRNDSALQSSNEYTAFTQGLSTMQTQISQLQALASARIIVQASEPTGVQAGYFWYKVMI